MWTLLISAAFAGPADPLLVATASGAGLGLALAAPPLIIGAVGGQDALPVGAALGGVALVAGSVLGVHAVTHGSGGAEVGGALVGSVVGTGVVVAGVGVALTTVVPYLESPSGAPLSARALAFGAIGVGAVVGVTMPALGAAVADQLGRNGRELAVGPTLLRGDHGPLVGLGLSLPLGGARRAGAGSPADPR